MIEDSTAHQVVDFGLKAVSAEVMSKVGSVKPRFSRVDVYDFTTQIVKLLSDELDARKFLDQVVEQMWELHDQRRENVLKPLLSCQ